MKRKTFFLLFLIFLLSGCLRGGPQEKPPECVSAEECFLCKRSGEGLWGQNNIGLISLNSFDMMPVEINLYDREGRPVEKSTGCLHLQSYHSGETGFWAGLTANPDRGHAMLSVELKGDLTADREKAAAFLCEECLDRIFPEERGEETGLGVIDFSTGEVKALDRQVPWFGLGDFYIHSDWEERGKKVSLMIFFSPLRYGEKE